MKTFLLLVLFSVSVATGFAQCGAPVVTIWNATDPENVIVHFDAPEGAESYQLKILGQYGYMDGADFSPLIIEGSAVPGANSITFDATVLVNSMLLQRYYFSAELSVSCINGSESALNHFYVSPFSMRNNPAIQTGQFFQPLTYLPDGAGFSYDSYITIPAVTGVQVIEDLSVFVDIGHTYAGDLTIELIGPQGQSVILYEGSGEIGGNEHSLSLMFQDGEQPLEEMEAMYGFCSPFESLSVFDGTDPTGVWVVRVTDNLSIDDGILFGVGLIINREPCGASLEGTAFYDTNGNNTQDPEENGLPLPVIQNTNDVVTMGNSVGDYRLCMLPGSGSISLVNPPLYYTSPDVPYSVTSGESLENLDFPLSAMPGIEDLKVDVFMNSMPNRPGFESTYFIEYANVGTECLQNISISAVFESFLNILSVSDASVSISGNEVNLSIPELCPQATGFFIVIVYTPDTVSIGTTSVVSASIEPVVNDETPQNNTSVSTTTVVGSYDPNDKSVSDTLISPLFLEEQKPLQYMVRFQNTGNYYAERVLIVDTLDSDLDPASFTLTSHSHPVQVTKTGNIFYFEFDNIFLPDSSTDEPGSHGFLRYEATPYPGLPDGNTIENTAYIFFDFNEAIITNTTVTTVDFQIGVENITVEASLFPNPASDFINIALPVTKGIDRVSIYSVTGKIVFSVSGNGNYHIQIPVSQLSRGTYFIQINNRGAVRPVLFVKE